MKLLKRGIRKNLGNGHSILMFQDPWIPRPTTFKVILQVETSMAKAKVAEFITPSVQWDMAKLQQFLVREDVDVITRLPISLNAPDRWIWHYDSRGEYSVKSGYKFSILNGQGASISDSGKQDSWWKKDLEVKSAQQS